MGYGLWERAPSDQVVVGLDDEAHRQPRAHVAPPALALLPSELR